MQLIGYPRYFSVIWAYCRAKTSLELPDPKGITISTGRLGKSTACAALLPPLFVHPVMEKAALITAAIPILATNFVFVICFLLNILDLFDNPVTSLAVFQAKALQNRIF
jgi:hypothetical protein